MGKYDIIRQTWGLYVYLGTKKSASGLIQAASACVRTGGVRVALGFFIMMLSACGAGTMAVLFFSLTCFAWKKERKAVAAILSLLGGLCAAFAVYMMIMFWDGLHFFF